MRWSEYTSRILSEINNEAFYVSELKNIQRRGTEFKAECPFKDMHQSGTDNTPSLTINVSRGVYYCQTCHSKGNVHTLYKTLYGLTNEQAWFELGDALKIVRPDSSKPTRPSVEVGLISEYHQNLTNLTGPIRDVLRQRRGLTDETLKRFQLGWDGERITIPVYDEFNSLANFRKYKWNSFEDQYKVTNYEDESGNTYGELRIFGIDNLLDENIENVVWCEGEMDRIINEQYGFPTSCPTSGAGSWKPEWSKYFRSKKKVYLAQDNDEAGRSATKGLCEKLFRIVDVYVINWPENFPAKGDITDFYTKCNQTAEDFRRLLDAATKYVDPTTELLLATEVDAIDVHLSDSAHSDLYGKRIKIPVMISGKDSTPYLCPNKVRLYCGDAADADNKRCASCDLAACAGEKIIEFSSSTQNLLKLIKCTEKQQTAAIIEIMGVDHKCPKFKIFNESYMNIEEIRMIPKAEANFGFAVDHEYVVRTGYYIGHDIKTNRRYTLVGHMYPDPQTQFATYVFDSAFPEKDVISDFEMSEDIHDQLKIFKLTGEQTVESKFNEIHADLERNVTYIWERREVAIAIDLVYHTALNFYFQEQFVKRGWGELLIIGDSGQAKTTIAERLMNHYRLGELHSGESSKRTGLIYSIQQNSKRWFLVWGAFPLNDGGLVCIDELSGISEDDLAVMSDVRSSGIAKSTGVIVAETTARTRVIYISNPRNGRPLNTEAHGVSAILKLFGKSEDVRRLDLAVGVSSGDIDPTLVNVSVSDMPPYPHVFTSDLCNLRVLWAWSRKPENIKFDKAASDAILFYATEMGRKYSSRVPIVEAADQRLKIARLSVGCAASVFSTDDTGENIIVTKEHVEYVVAFMNKAYASKSLGYDKLSEQEQENSDSSVDGMNKLRKKFLLLPLQDFNEAAKILYTLTYFSRATLEDYTGLLRDDLKGLLKFLTTEHLVEKYKGDYRRFPLGTEFIENILTNPVTRSEIDEARKEFYSAADY